MGLTQDWPLAVFANRLAPTNPGYWECFVRGKNYSNPIPIGRQGDIFYLVFEVTGDNAYVDISGIYEDLADFCKEINVGH
jgi:hypothetical protein